MMFKPLMDLNLYDLDLVLTICSNGFEAAGKASQRLSKKKTVAWRPPLRYEASGRLVKKKHLGLEEGISLGEEGK
tara:strand:+ start:278 stop:502 length:225 start_codon:yes stop_codon:yes gene_type:complete